MGTDPAKDPEAVVFYLYKTMQDLKVSVDSLNNQTSKLTVEIALLKQSNGLKSKIKDGAAPAGLGTVFAALLMGFWEYFKVR